MKSSPLSRKLLGTSLAAMLTLTLFSNSALARDRDDRKDRRDDRQDNRQDNRDDRQDNRQDRRDDRRDDDDRYRRNYYYSRPRTSYSVTFGSGYAGRGYYYGPVGVPYYYENPGVTYYATRTAVPAQYYVAPATASAGPTLQQSVQIRLSQEGYYHDTIDGDIGPASHRAISRYQADHGLRVTGTISDGLLRSLKIN